VASGCGSELNLDVDAPMGNGSFSAMSIHPHASPTTMRAAVERLPWGTERVPEGAHG
jgi:hypothetical protein